MGDQINELKEKVSVRFDEWAGRYDKSVLQNLVFRKSHHMFVQEINPHPEMKITLLDVGCGTGEFIFNLAGNPRL